MASKHHISNKRKESTRRAIQAKLDVLNHLDAQDSISDAFFPTSLEKFRTWEDKEKGLSRIGSKSTIYNDDYADLINQVQNVIESLKHKKTAIKRRRSRTAELQQLTVRNKQLTRELQVLVNDYHQVSGALEQEQKRAERLERRITELRGDLKDALQRIRSLEELKVIGR